VSSAQFKVGQRQQLLVVLGGAGGAAKYVVGEGGFQKWPKWH